MKTRDAIKGFHLLKNSHKLCQGFHQAMMALITCFISFIKLYSISTKRKTLYEARMYTFHETVNSHNLETETAMLRTSVLCFIVL